MQKLQVFITILLFPVSAWAQEVIVQGRVVDAETGEALPYVSIYVKEGKGALTNADGEFMLCVSKEDMLTFSYVSYEKQRIIASEVPKIVRLKAFERMLSEVVVKPVDERNVLKLVMRNLKQDYKKHKGERQGYYLRALMKNSKDSYLVESLMAGLSAVNLRNAETLSGRSGLNAKGGESEMKLRLTNIHHLAELGARTYQSTYWESVIKPLTSMAMIKKYYKVEMEILHGSDGEKLYRYTFQWNDKHTKDIGQRRYLTGTIDVDAKNLRLLRFEGNVGNAYQWVNLQRTPTTIKFHMSYDYSHGYAAVSNIAVEGGNDRMKYRTLLFNIPDDNLFATSSGYSGGNILYSVDVAGYDSTLWERYDIVKRTKEEEIAAFGDSTIDRQEMKIPDTRNAISYSAAFRPLMEHLLDYNKNMPQEKVFVHMDNTCYFQGDTIWFTAYTRQTNNGVPSDISGVLYAELLNNDGYLVERKLVEMKNGRGNGFFALNNQIQYSGFYELRAYTRWQLNWGEHEHEHPSSYGLMFRDRDMEREYFRDYDKLYSRVFPVYDKPLAPGDYNRNMTMRVMRRSFKTDMDEKERKPVLTLFPEGGNLVAGVENRVAFEAAMSDGEQLEGTLDFGNERVKTVNRGRGTFTFVPQKDMDRKVSFLTVDGKTFSGKLPEPVEKGAAIMVAQKRDSMTIEIKLAHLDVDSMALTIMHEGNVEEFHPLSESLNIKTGNLPLGIHQVSVFDTNGRVWADRLFFVTKPEMAEQTLTVSGMKDEYIPYEKVEMKVAGTAKSAPISLAVHDGNQSDPIFDNGNIMTEMLLSSEIKGFIPNPEWFFEKDDKEHHDALDLLMMTQGWRRFVWKEMASKGEDVFTQPAEKTPILRGFIFYNPNRVARMIPEDMLMDSVGNQNMILNHRNIPNPSRLDYKNSLALAKKAIKQGLLVHAELVSSDGKEIAVNEEPFTDEHFQIQCPLFHGNKEFFLSVADTTGWRKNNIQYSWVQIAEEADDSSVGLRKTPETGESDYRAYILWHYPRFVKPYSFYQSHMPQNDKDSEFDIPFELLADTVKTMREVAVTAKRRNRLKRFNDAYPAFSVDAYEAWNTIEDAGVPLFNHVDVGDAIVRVYLNDYGVENDGSRESRINLQFGLSPSRRALPQYIDIPLDSLYHPKYLTSVAKDFWFSPGERREYFGDERVNEDPRFRIDRFIIYTDYQPRHEGSSRYVGANRPETRIAVYPIYDGGRRLVYRDRRYILPGFASPAEFYSPDYSSQIPPEPTDYRRTLYWNPNLKLDEKGEAHITFYNNCRTTHLSVEAEGQATDGTLLWGKTE